jgi:hypothetical protein
MIVCRPLRNCGEAQVTGALPRSLINPGVPKGPLTRLCRISIERIRTGHRHKRSQRSRALGSGTCGKPSFSSSCREPALAARRTRQARNETVVIRFLINAMSQSGVSEPAGSSARSFMARANSILSVPHQVANIDSVVGIRR